MAAHPLSDELAQQAVDAYLAHGRQKAPAARALGIPPGTFDKRIDIASRRGLIPPAEPTMPGFEVKTVSQKTADGAWVKQARAPGAEFEIPQGHIVKGESALIDPDGRVIQKWVKTREDRQPVLEDAIRAAFEQYGGLTTLPPPPEHTDADLLTVYPIADLHLGMFSWAKETGADYDLKIAADLLTKSMADLVARAASAQCAVVLDLGDYFHSDNSQNRTMRSGNALDVDSRYAKVVQVGYELTIRCLELALQKHETVEYRKLPGNHDEHTSTMLAVAVAAHFRNEPRVRVETGPSRFYMRRHGKCLLAGTHGDMLKMGDLAGFVAANWPKEWGATTFRYGYSGHVHNERAMNVSSLRGMRVESFNTIAAKDAWHAGEGYQSTRSMSAITLHKDRGETDRLTVNIK